jgi:predicted regulator of amino acid metabolism with ACT domain
LSDRLLKINVLEEDLQDGVFLHELMEIISSKKIKIESKTPKSKFQKIGNLSLVFSFIADEKIKLVNIGSEDIFNGNSKLILGTLEIQNHF